MFSDRSRHAGLPLRERVDAHGRRIVHVTVRPVPPAAASAAGAPVRISDSDRLDGLAWRLTGDPGAWWMLADANGALHPGDVLEAPGADIRAPAPGAAGLRR